MIQVDGPSLKRRQRIRRRLKLLVLREVAQTDVAACQPVVDQWSSQPAHPRQVYTGAMVTDTADKDKGAKAISLTVIACNLLGDALQHRFDRTIARRA